MLDAARKAVTYCQNRERADLEKDELLALATVRLVEIIGEAARGVSQECQSEVPQIPWQELIGTRDRLIHRDAEVALDIVWTMVTEDLPLLIATLEKIVPPDRD